MRPDPPDAAPIFLAAVICALMALIAFLAPGARAITAVPASYDVAGVAWAADATRTPAPPIGDDLAHLLDSW
jgi:hypothetical protein